MLSGEGYSPHSPLMTVIPLRRRAHAAVSVSDAHRRDDPRAGAEPETAMRLEGNNWARVHEYEAAQFHSASIETARADFAKFSVQFHYHQRLAELLGVSLHQQRLGEHVPVVGEVLDQGLGQQNHELRPRS